MLFNGSYLSRIRPLLQLPIVSAGVVIFTWGMNILYAPTSLWIVTGLVAIYLLWVGKAGILPASMWISFLIFLAILNDQRPHFWFEGRSLYRYWAMGLGLFWSLGVGLVYFISHHVEICARYPSKIYQQLRVLSLAAIVSGYCLGQLLYEAGLQQ